MIILRLTCTSPTTTEKKPPPTDSLIPSLLVGFLPPVQTSLQMTLRDLSSSSNNIRVRLLQLLTKVSVLLNPSANKVALF